MEILVARLAFSMLESEREKEGDIFEKRLSMCWSYPFQL